MKEWIGLPHLIGNYYCRFLDYSNGAYPLWFQFVFYNISVCCIREYISSIGGMVWAWWYTIEQQAFDRYLLSSSYVPVQELPYSQLEKTFAQIMITGFYTDSWWDKSE